MQHYYVIGLMSGTSLDGLDLVYVEFTVLNGTWNYQLIKAQTIPYQKYLKEEVQKVSGKEPSEYLKNLDVKLGEWMGECTYNFIQALNTPIDLIASHGQTIYHNPAKGITIQLGNGEAIAKACGIPVINDFRVQDVLLGGQGAPLVPIGDLMLFPEYNYCLNLGGIANISIKSGSSISAYDICICNIGANFLSNKLGFEFDENGRIGAKGELITDVFNDWNKINYFQDKGPKSLDASFFKSSMLPSLGEIKNEDVPNMLRTMYEHIAFQISLNLVQKNEQILLTGGGAKNQFLIDILRDKYHLNITNVDPLIIDFKEALIFALLGVLRFRNEINVLSTVTGATKDHSSGQINYPFQKVN